MYLIVAGILMILVGAGCGLGAMALRRGAPKNWPDVIAGDAVARRTALGLLVVSVALFATGVGSALGYLWAVRIGGVALAMFVAGGFWGNYAIFGDLRPRHTIANVVIAAVIFGLLWIGYPD